MAFPLSVYVFPRNEHGTAELCCIFHPADLPIALHIIEYFIHHLSVLDSEGVRLGGQADLVLPALASHV